MCPGAFHYFWFYYKLIYIGRSSKKGIWRPDACRWVGSSLAQVRLICLLGSRKSFLCFVCSRSTVRGVKTIYFGSWKKRKLKKSRYGFQIIGRTKAKTKFRWASCSNRTSWRKRIRPLRNSSLQVLLYTTSIFFPIFIFGRSDNWALKEKNCSSYLWCDNKTRSCLIWKVLGWDVCSSRWRVGLVGVPHSIAVLESCYFRGWCDVWAWINP